MENHKYEFTGETRVSLGVTFRRIRSKIAFGMVLVGTLGGWIEDEGNLSISGNAWIDGDAKVSGNAQVYGDACGL